MSASWMPLQEGMSKQLLQSAKQLGNVPAVERLVATLSPRTYTLEVLDIILYHIRFALPHPLPLFYPGKKFPPMSSNIRCAAICAKEALYLSLHVSRHAGLWQQTLDKIRPVVDDLLYCLEFLLWYPDPSGAPPGASIANPAKSCVVLIDLTRQCPDMRKTILTSYKTIDIAIGAWALQDAQGYPYILAGLGEGKNECPLSRLLLDVFEYSDDNRQRVFDILAGHSKKSRFLRKRMVHNALARYEEHAGMDRATSERILKRQAQQMAAQSLMDISSQRLSALQQTMVYLETVTKVLSNLCEDPILSREMLQAGVFDAGNETLRNWMIHQSYRSSKMDLQDRLIGYSTLQKMQDLIQQWSWAFRKLSVGAHLAFVESGVIPILIEGMQTVPIKDKDNSLAILDCLDRLKFTCQTSPSAASELVKPLVEARGAEYWDTLFLRGTGYERAWKELCWYVRAGSTLQTQKQPNLCDNLNCPETRANYVEPRTCGGCHVMVYCSKSCQATDWKLQHREECKLASEADEGGRVNGLVRYRQALRLSHATYVNRLANILFQEGDIEKLLAKSPSPVLRLLTSLPPTTMTPQQYLLEHGLVQPASNGSTSLTQNHYLDRRTQRLILNCAAHGKAHGLRIVESSFPFGTKHVVVLTMLQKTAMCDPKEDSPSNRYTLRYCITRFWEARK